MLDKFVWINVTSGFNPRVRDVFTRSAWRLNEEDGEWYITAGIPVSFPTPGPYTLKPKWTEVYVNSDCRPTPTTISVVYTASGKAPWTVTRVMPPMTRAPTLSRVQASPLIMEVRNVPCYAHVAILEKMRGDKFTGDNVIAAWQSESDNCYNDELQTYDTCSNSTRTLAFDLFLHGEHTYQPIAFLPGTTSIYGAKVTTTADRMFVEESMYSRKHFANIYGNMRLPMSNLNLTRATMTATGFSIVQDGSTRCQTAATFATEVYEPVKVYSMSASCTFSLATHCHGMTETWSLMNTGSVLATTTFVNLHTNQKLCPPTEVITKTAKTTTTLFSTVTPTTTICVTGKPKLNRRQTEEVQVEDYTEKYLAPTTIKYKAKWTPTVLRRNDESFYGVTFTATASPPFPTEAYYEVDLGLPGWANAEGKGSKFTMSMNLEIGTFKLLPTLTRNSEECFDLGWDCFSCRYETTVYEPLTTTRFWPITVSAVSTTSTKSKMSAPTVSTYSVYGPVRFRVSFPGNVPDVLLDKGVVLRRRDQDYNWCDDDGEDCNLGYHLQLGNGVHELCGGNYQHTESVLNPTISAGPTTTFTVSQAPYQWQPSYVDVTTQATLSIEATLPWESLTEALTVDLDPTDCPAVQTTSPRGTMTMTEMASFVSIYSDGQKLCDPVIVKVLPTQPCGLWAHAEFPSYTVACNVTVATPLCFPAIQTVTVMDGRGSQSLTMTTEWTNSWTRGATACPSTSRVMSTITKTVQRRASKTFVVTRTSSTCTTKKG